MATSGWVYWDYNYYYPRSWGGMYKNAFITYDNNLYYLGSDSKMAIGWQSIGGNTYYFRNWGGMITGKQVIDGKTYVFDEDGKLVQSPDGFEPSAQIGVRTVRNFLKMHCFHLETPCISGEAATQTQRQRVTASMRSGNNSSIHRIPPTTIPIICMSTEKVLTVPAMSDGPHIR